MKVKDVTGRRPDPELILNSLRTLTDIFEDIGVKYWMETGNLLGAVRDGKLIPWDFDVDIDDVREIFMNPEASKDYTIEAGTFDVDGILEFLTEERDFNRERLENTLYKTERELQEKKAQTTLDAFF